MATRETVENHLSPVELMKLPPQQREEILAAAAALAEDEYRTNHDLTDFEAFDEGESHAGSEER